MAKPKHPLVYIIAGSNGAGKTTFAKEFLLKQVHCKEFINADFLAQGFSPFAPEAAAMKAGRFVLERIQEFAHENKTFAFETTLSGKTYVHVLKSLKKKGYLINLYFLWLPNVEIALKRIKERTLRGGHHIPEKDVRRRFKQGLFNFFKLYEPLLNFWSIIDNYEVPPKTIAFKEQGILTVYDKSLYHKILEITEHET